MDWRSGTAYRRPQAVAPNEGDACTLFFGGDWAPEAGHLSTIQTNSCSVYGSLLDVMKAADVTVINLEGAIADQALTPIAKDGSTIRLPSSVLGGLTCVPVGLACMANNHTYDLGCEGLHATLSQLRSAGIGVVGAGSSVAEAVEPYVVTHNDLRIGIINAAEGEEGRASEGRGGVADWAAARIVDQVHALRADCNAIVAVLHGGREFLPVPAPYVRSAYRQIAEAGVDLVVGHHPHVPQGIEIYAGVPIAYSLGNFIFQPEGPPRLVRLGYGLSAAFDRQGLAALSVHPYRIQPVGIERLAGEECTTFLNDLRGLSEIVVDDERLTALWNAYCLLSMERFGLAEMVQALGVLSTPQALRLALLESLEGPPGKLARWKRRLRRLVLEALQPGMDDRRSSPTNEASKVRAAAILCNRFDTLAHRELYITALSQRMKGIERAGPQWAIDLLNEWSVFEQE